MIWGRICLPFCALPALAAPLLGPPLRVVGFKGREWLRVSDHAPPAHSSAWLGPARSGVKRETLHFSHPYLDRWRAPYGVRAPIALAPGGSGPPVGECGSR